MIKILDGMNTGTAPFNQKDQDQLTQTHVPSSQSITLLEYLQSPNPKPRGDGKNGTMLYHDPTFIVRNHGCLELFSLDQLNRFIPSESEGGIEVVDLHSIGNQFQQIINTVHGVNPCGPSKEFVRPVVKERPGAGLSVFAFNPAGMPIFFRPLQVRNGRVYLDGFRGFLDDEAMKALQTVKPGNPIQVNEDFILGNVRRILGEEGGRKFLEIKDDIIYLGAPIANVTYTISDLPLFAVQVDYKTIISSASVLDQEEIERRREQFTHEGMLGEVVAMSPDQFDDYVCDPHIVRCLASDEPNRIVQKLIEKGKIRPC